MNYDSPELLDRLAAEYVLGTLRGPARARFARLCAASTAARQALHRWEDDFSALSRALEPVQPSARVWLDLRRRIDAGGARSPRPSFWRRWSLAAAASLAAVALIVGLLVHEQRVSLQAVAVLGSDAAHPVWRVERAKELTALTIRVVGPVRAAPEKAYELWALPRGGKPVSLGLLPLGGRLERPLTEVQRAALLTADKLAVSIEPAGGSPTGSPTGPVVMVGSVLG
ncbi:MAG TPA: anti-sigma factor [Steroidobacteraceae bacterium]